MSNGERLTVAQITQAMLLVAKGRHIFDPKVAPGRKYLILSGGIPHEPGTPEKRWAFLRVRIPTGGDDTVKISDPRGNCLGEIELDGSISDMEKELDSAAYCALFREIA